MTVNSEATKGLGEILDAIEETGARVRNVDDLKLSRTNKATKNRIGETEVVDVDYEVELTVVFTSNVKDDE